jgi:predicted ester cyclase
MSTEANKAIVRRLFEEAINIGNLTLADAALDSNYVDYSTFAPPAPGVEGFKLRIAGFRKTFPDGHFSVDDIFADGSGDKVAFRWTFRGTDQGG